MPLDKKQIQRILKKYADVFEMLENYDKTRELPFQRKRIDITLSVVTINKLKAMSKQSGKPISRIIEERITEMKELDNIWKEVDSGKCKSYKTEDFFKQMKTR